jgi:hypothetical protein
MCDTLAALSPATADGSVIFAKNSDRPASEAQHVQYYPSSIYLRDAQLECTYITIPQARETHAVLLSQIDWMWGAEMGANDQGIIIGNEAVWTRAAMGPPALLGMEMHVWGWNAVPQPRPAWTSSLSYLKPTAKAAPARKLMTASPITIHFDCRPDGGLGAGDRWEILGHRAGAAIRSEYFQRPDDPDKP